MKRQGALASTAFSTYQNYTNHALLGDDRNLIADGNSLRDNYGSINNYAVGIGSFSPCLRDNDTLGTLGIS